MRELSECILSTLLGSFTLTWKIHEVYCHLKMMNFSVDVLVYRPSAFPEKKKKRKGSFPQGVGVTSTPVLPYSYMYSNMPLAGCWLVSAHVIGLPQGKKDAGPGGLYNGWSNFENFPPIRGGGI